MKSFGYLVIALTLLLSAVAVWIYLNRDKARAPSSSRMMPDTFSPSAPKSHAPSPILPSPVLPSRPFVPSPKEQVSFAMDEVIVKSMISQARTSSLKGDAVTTGALIKGLKTHRTTSEKLLVAEIASAPDPETKRHLENILANISGESQ